MSSHCASRRDCQGCTCTQRRRRGRHRVWTGFPTKKIGITFRARIMCVAIVCFCMYNFANCVFQVYKHIYLSLLQAHSVIVLVHQPPIAQASIVFSCTCVCTRESNSARITHRFSENELPPEAKVLGHVTVV
jgi:hypothetical protein